MFMLVYGSQIESEKVGHGYMSCILKLSEAGVNKYKDFRFRSYFYFHTDHRFVGTGQCEITRFARMET